MDIIVILLRILHIGAGIYWVGAGVFMVAFLFPTVEALGVDGSKFLQRMLLNRLFVMSMPAASGITTLAGIILFIRYFNTGYLGTTPGIVLSIGVLFGLLAFGHGGAAMGPATTKYENLAKTIATQPNGATPEQTQELNELGSKIARNARISVALTIIAVLGMVSFRYF